jgi:hypothetical protein
MFRLPPSLTRHFQDPSGRFDPLQLLRTPDEQLLHLARHMPDAERVDLYRQLARLRLGWLERMALQAAGVDLDWQRARFLRILDAAAA